MCDTMVALGNVTKNGKVIFAKNSDRHPDEPAEILHIPRKQYPQGSEVRTTYITIPQVRETAEIILCKPIWIWGAEMGSNEYGVTIGNEAVYTKEKFHKKGRLIGMDLLRLGLERSKTAKEALEIIIDLLELFGQGGNCGYRSKDYYHNSFLITDPNEAWLLETAGEYWIAEKVTDIRTISNSISIRGRGEIMHPELIDNALRKGWCKNSDQFDFYNNYCKKTKIQQVVLKGLSRSSCSTLKLQNALGKIDEKIMMQILRHHEPKKDSQIHTQNPPYNKNWDSICIHAKNIPNPSQSTISMISILDKNIQTHWITGTSAPCTSVFKPIFLPGGMPKIGSEATEYYHKENIWWRHEVLHRLVLNDYSNRIEVYKNERDELEDKSIDQVLKLLKVLEDKDKNEITQVLREFTMKQFSEAMLKEEKWIKKIKDMPIITKPPIFYRAFWKKRNKRNKMPNIQM